MRFPAISLILLALLSGCTLVSPLTGPNAFLTLAEQFGAESLAETDDDDTTTGGSGTTVDLPFRLSMDLTLANNATDVDLEVSVAAWVLPSSLRTTEQEDSLFNDGYVRVNQRLRIGVLDIPEGSFIRDGGGFAGAEAITIAGPGDGGNATEVVRTMVTPDVLLIFKETPRSCESVAFEFTQGGEPILGQIIRNDTTLGATNAGGRKTYAQVDAYQCSPFEPGLYFRAGGGARSANEYFEGQSVRVDFIRGVADNGSAAFVSIE